MSVIRITKLINATLMIILLVAPFYYQPNISGVGLYLPNNFVIYSFVMLLITLVSMLVVKKQEISMPVNFYLYLLYLTVFVFLVIFLGDINKTALYTRLSVIVLGILFLFSLYQIKESDQYFFKIIFISLLIHSLVFVVQRYDLLERGRFIPVNGGVFQQVNLQATVMVVFFILSLYFLLKAFKEKEPIFYNIYADLLLSFVGFFLSIYNLINLNSRVGVLSLFISVLIFSAPNFKKISFKKASFAIIVFSSIFLYASTTESTSNLIQKFERVFVNEGSGELRIDMYKITYDLILEKPIFGYGVGSFPEIYQDAREFYRDKFNSSNLNSEATTVHPHNEILFILYEQGLIGFLFVLFLFGSILKIIIKNNSSNKYLYLSLLFPLVMHSMVEHPFYTSIYHWLLFVIFLFLSNRYTDKKFFLNNYFLKSFNVFVFFLVFLSIYIFYFSYNSLKASRGIHDFVVKRADTSNLQLSVDNFILNPVGEQLFMQVFLNVEIKRNNIRNVSRYLDWALDFNRIHPSINGFIDIARAYQYLGECDSAILYAKKAAGIYNAEPALQFFNDLKSKDCDKL